MYRIEFVDARELRYEQDDRQWQRAVTRYSNEAEATQEAEWLSISDDGHAYRVVVE